jgi:hypothetical protein
VSKWDDEMVETIGWFVTEGHFNGGHTVITQSSKHTPHIETLRRLAGYWRDQGFPTAEYGPYQDRSVMTFYWKMAPVLRDVVGADKQLPPEFLTSLTYRQATALYDTLLAGDGNRQKGTQDAKGEFFYQKDLGRIGGFQMLAAMLGKRTSAAHDGDEQWTVTAYQNRHLWEKDLRKSQEYYTGRVWCPTTSTGTWFVRRREVMPVSDSSTGKGSSGRSICYMTGNCFP